MPVGNKKINTQLSAEWPPRPRGLTLINIPALSELRSLHKVTRLYLVHLFTELQRTWREQDAVFFLATETLTEFKHWQNRMVLLQVWLRSAFPVFRTWKNKQNSTSLQTWNNRKTYGKFCTFWTRITLQDSYSMGRKKFIIRQATDRRKTMRLSCSADEIITWTLFHWYGSRDSSVSIMDRLRDGVPRHQGSIPSR
jgi:hypothetical protein